MKNSNPIKPSVELVVDYVDTELTCTTENSYNTNWTQVTDIQTLEDSGHISPESSTAVKNGYYLVFKTDYFGR